MSLYNERTRHCTMDDVNLSKDARTAAALYMLASWFDFDPDGLGRDLAVEIDECEPEGNTNDMLTDQMLDELRTDYRNHPEACVSWLTAAVADKRSKTK